MNDMGDDDDNCSNVSSTIGGNNGSVVSTVPDRYGFLGGSQYTPDTKQIVPPKVLLRRERKWLKMIDDWDDYMAKHYSKVRARCRKGIPPSIRPRAWLYICGGKKEKDKNNDLYKSLCEQEGNFRWNEDIRKDLHRQFPYHEMFMNSEGHGQKDLYNVLKAYSIYDPKIGYCQAQAPIAAFLLMFMPAEDAFWCLVKICGKYLPGYYSQGMETLQIDGDMLFAFVKRVYPSIYKHLKKQKIEPILYMTEWFLCVYTRTLPWPTLLRVWDMFLCEGVKVIFKVALVLIRICLRSKKSVSLKKQYPTMYETLEALRNPPLHLLEEDFIVEQIFKMNLTEDDFAQEHERQVQKRRAANQSNANNSRQ